jgi:signal transduction histidine kinase
VSKALGRAPDKPSRTRGPSIALLLLGANAIVLLTPVLAVIGLRLYDVVLLRQTERQLIAESVLVGEALRDAYVRAGDSQDLGDHRPPAHVRDRYVPVESKIDIGTEVLPASVRVTPRTESPSQRLATAGAAIEPLMERAQTFNLSGVRVLDPSGCVVATTGGQRDQCLNAAPEVQRAMAGDYAASLRERISDEPAPPYGDIRRRGAVRVFTALPIWHGERVIAIVGASRTGLDALSSLWQNRRQLIAVAVAAVLLWAVAALFFAWTIARPLRLLTEAARQIVTTGRAHDVQALHPSGFVPREVEVLSAALREMTERLQRRADEAAERSANASHELKTPLSAIRGAVELLRDGWRDMPDAQRDRFIANIDADADRMERLVTRMLALARIESEAGKDAPLLEVEPLVRVWLGRYEDVQLEVEPGVPALAIREDHLASVVQNLVENARRHGAGKPVLVRLAPASGDRPRVRIEVSDQGGGVSEGNRERIFDRFFTTERDRGGTGLGLAIVRAVALARGGSVELAARGDEGRTTFVAIL